MSIAGGTDEIQHNILARADPRAARGSPRPTATCRSAGCAGTDVTRRSDGPPRPRRRPPLTTRSHGAATGRTPLLLTHGYSASSAMWKPNLPALTADRQVITWDIRGHGRSASPADPARYSEDASVADMAAVLDACGVAAPPSAACRWAGTCRSRSTSPTRRASRRCCCSTPGPASGRIEARERWNAYAAEGRGASSAMGSTRCRRAPRSERARTTRSGSRWPHAASSPSTTRGCSTRCRRSACRR